MAVQLGYEPDADLATETGGGAHGGATHYNGETSSPGYLEGYADGDADGQVTGYAAGYAAGYAVGFAAGLATTPELPTPPTPVPAPIVFGDPAYDDVIAAALDRIPHRRRSDA